MRDRSVHVDAAVDAVLVLKGGPVKTPEAFVAAKLAFSAAWMRA